MRIRYLFLCLFPLFLFYSCVDGSYDPEGRWELNSKEADDCEDNDLFAEAYEPSSDLELLYLNFYDDIVDYFLCSFDDRYTYTITADVPFDHLSDTTIYVFDTNQEQVDVSVEDPDDDRDAVIEGFTPTDSRYYVLVVNSLSSGTGELRGYMLTISEEN